MRSVPSSRVSCMFVGLGLTLLVTLAGACSDEAGTKATSSSSTDGGAEGDGGKVDFSSGEELRVPVGEGVRAYVKLGSPPSIVTPADAKTDKGWDLAFEGADVYTNSGPSGSGTGGSFGPLDGLTFLGDTAPQVPFIAADSTGGAFLRWWFYDGTNHALYSRFHVYGVKDGDKQYKVQVLGYYGEEAGAPVSARYRVRWAEITAGGVGQVQDVADIDGTAGGTQTTSDTPSECLDLGTGARTSLTSAQARESTAWHVCFRRQDISVNGELGGPRNVGAVDLDAANVASETLANVSPKTPESEQAHFDAINASSLTGQSFRGDRIVSGFGSLWLERGASTLTPANDAWLVVGANGQSKYLVGFVGFEGATATAPGTIVMRVKAVH